MANLNVTLKNTSGDILYPQTLASNVLNLESFIQGQISSAGLLNREIVTSLPDVSISESTIYMILKDPSGAAGNVYNEYMYINGAWELVGDTAVDLTGYATEAYVTDAIANKADKATTLDGYGITDAASAADLASMKSELEASIATKADASALDAKADQTALDELSDSVSDLRTTVEGLVSSQISYTVID